MKKGQVNMGLVVTIVIVVAVLIIAIGFFIRAKFTQGIDKESCHQSIIARSTFNLGTAAEAGKRFIPLNCKTEKVCISQSGQNCGALGNPSKDNPITRVDIGKGVPKAVVMDRLANDLYDYNNVIGNGDLNFMPSTAFSTNYCLISERIASDSALRKSVSDIGYAEFYRYLASKKTPAGTSYLKAIYGFEKPEDMYSILEKVKEISNKNKDRKEKIDSIEDIKIGLQGFQGVAIVAMISPNSQWNEWTGWATAVAGVAVTGVAIYAAPFTLGGSTALIGVGTSLIGVGLAEGSIYDTGSILEEKQFAVPFIIRKTPDGALFAYPTFMPYNPESLNKLGCSEFSIS